MTKVTVVGAAAIWDHIFPVNKLPSVGDIVKIERLHQAPLPGGCAPNIALGIARLCDCQTVLYYPVGNDFEESGLEAFWSKEGVDCTHLTRVADEKSGSSWMYMQPDGSTMCFAYAGAADIAMPVAVENLSEWVVIAPVLNQFTAFFLDEAKKQGKKLVLTGICAKEIVPFLSSAYAVIINQHEAKLLAAAQGYATIRGLAESLTNTILYITQGKKGSMVFYKGEFFSIPIIPEEKVQDFTGAGDAYTSGVVSGLMMGMKPENAAYIGSTNSSFVVEEYGGQTNIPHWEQLKQRLALHVPGFMN